MFIEKHITTLSFICFKIMFIEKHIITLSFICCKHTGSLTVIDLYLIDYFWKICLLIAPNVISVQAAKNQHLYCQI
jgi:hypothetical protein